MPLFILLIGYLIALGLWALMSTLVIGHLMRYAGIKPSAMATIGIYTSLSIIILTITWISLSQIEWQTSSPFLSF